MMEWISLVVSLMYLFPAAPVGKRKWFFSPKHNFFIYSVDAVNDGFPIICSPFKSGLFIYRFGCWRWADLIQWNWRRWQRRCVLLFRDVSFSVWHHCNGFIFSLVFFFFFWSFSPRILIILALSLVICSSSFCRESATAIFTRKSSLFCRVVIYFASKLRWSFIHGRQFMCWTAGKL